jgi:hypothetical protein
LVAKAAYTAATASPLRSLTQIGNTEWLHACSVKSRSSFKVQLHGLHPMGVFTHSILPETGIPDSLSEFHERVRIERWFDLSQSFDAPDGMEVHLMHTSRLLRCGGDHCVLHTDHEVPHRPGGTLIIAKVQLHEIVKVIADAAAV